MAAARAAIRAFLAADAAEPLDAIIVNASGCGTTVKDYGHMFARDPDRAGAERVASLAAGAALRLLGDRRRVVLCTAEATGPVAAATTTVSPALGLPMLRSPV